MRLDGHSCPGSGEELQDGKGEARRWSLLSCPGSCEKLQDGKDGGGGKMVTVLSYPAMSCPTLTEVVRNCRTSRERWDEMVTPVLSRKL